MYYDEKWEELTPDEAERLLNDVSPVDGKYATSPDNTHVHKQPLPFYDDVLLLRLTDENWNRENLAIYYLSDKGLLYRLNGHVRSIDAVNAKAPLKLAEENVLDYLRFFGFFVRGENGPFIDLPPLTGPG